MKCWHCNNDVIWGGDFDYEDYGLEGEGIVSNMSCSECEAYYEVYLPFGEKKEEISEEV
tara:strand:+ start:4218 stop:4394 length:177 start_codon:yes stop_codon:yes gene_type:complete